VDGGEALFSIDARPFFGPIFLRPDAYRCLSTRMIGGGWWVRTHRRLLEECRSCGGQSRLGPLVLSPSKQHHAEERL